MADVLWRSDAKSIVHRIIWFLLDVGAPGHVMQHGWQLEAARQLGIHRITLRRQIEIMVAAGILFEGEKKGEVMLNTAVFSRVADKSKLRMMRHNGRKF